MGRDMLIRRIEQSAGNPAIATSQALVAAFRALNAKRILNAHACPQSVNDAGGALCAHHGVEVVEEHGLNLPPTVSTASVSEDEWFAKMLAMKRLTWTPTS